MTYTNTCIYTIRADRYVFFPDMQQLLTIAAPHFDATEPGGVQVQVRDSGHWVEFEGLWLWLGVMKDIERS